MCTDWPPHQGWVQAGRASCRRRPASWVWKKSPEFARERSTGRHFKELEPIVWRPRAGACLHLAVGWTEVWLGRVEERVGPGYWWKPLRSLDWIDPRSKMLKGKADFALPLFEGRAPIIRPCKNLEDFPITQIVGNKGCTLCWMRLAKTALICLKLLCEHQKIERLASMLATKFCFIIRLFLKGKGTAIQMQNGDYKWSSNSKDKGLCVIM